jgi:hypothetical protein
VLVQGIPSSQIVATASRRNRDYEVEFINADINNDVYTLKTFLRKNAHDSQYKVRVIIVSNTLAYPALDMVWSFPEEEYDKAARVYHRICDEIDDIKTDFDASMKPITVVAGHVREFLKLISVDHIEKTSILWLDEAARVRGEPDARMTIYHGHYPRTTKAEKDKIHKFVGNNGDEIVVRHVYPGRGR